MKEMDQKQKMSYTENCCCKLHIFIYVREHFCMPKKSTLRNSGNAAYASNREHNNIDIVIKLWFEHCLDLIIYKFYIGFYNNK